MTDKPRRLLPTAVIAVACGVTPAAIRKLTQRGKITRYGTQKRALYDLDEVAGQYPEDEE